MTSLSSVVGWLASRPFPICVLLATALALGALVVRRMGDPAEEPRRRINSIAMLLLAGLVIAIGGALYFVGGGRWGYLLALLPGATIARHAVYMRLIRRRALVAPVSPPPGLGRTGTAESGSLETQDPSLALVFARARQMHDVDFAPETLAVRFGIPALLTTAIGIGVFEFLQAPPPVFSKEAVRAAQLGAAGAMVYVLLYLGRRGFRSDITTGAALWSAIVLAIGPVFGAVLSRIWSGDQAPPSGWTRDALYFVAGMSPRHVASAVEEAVRRLWSSRAPAPQVQPRAQPLTLLRGVTESIEDRLGEDGITDVQGMAMADPLKLFRSTSFDKRQILSWIDEALLISWLPEQWSAVQKAGVTGAIDLMAHVQQHEAQLRKVLAESAKLEESQVEAVMLAGTVLKEDAQLRLVWALYQFDEEGPDAAGDLEADAPGVTPPIRPGVAVAAPGWLLGALAFGAGAAAAGTARVSVSQAVAPLAVLILSLALALTVRWPWPNRWARALPLAAVLVLAAGVYFARTVLAPALAWRLPVQQVLLGAAAVCVSLSLVRAVAGAVGGTLTIDFPNGAPLDAQLWVDGRAVPIERPVSNPTVCPVRGGGISVVVQAGGARYQRWLDTQGQRSSNVSIPLPATIIPQVQPPAAKPRYRVDGADHGLGPLRLLPRGVPYAVVAEANGFLPGTGSVTVDRAEDIALPLRLEPVPTVVLKLDPPEATLSGCRVDGVDFGLSSLRLAPRDAPYSIVVEAAGFLPGGANVKVDRAAEILLPIRLLPAPPPRKSSGA